MRNLIIGVLHFFMADPLKDTAGANLLDTKGDALEDTKETAGAAGGLGSLGTDLTMT